MYKGGVIWFTGLSGAGKTTLANALSSRMELEGLKPVKIDGDEMRDIWSNIGFSPDDRKAHNLNMGKLAAYFENQGHWVLASFISPYEEIRNKIRGFCTNFVEIYVSTPLEVCIERDPKGLYKKVIKGEIRNFSGVDAPFEIPETPSLVLDTSKIGLIEAVEIIYHKFIK